MNKIVKKEIDFLGKKLVLETGELAVQANMSVKATYGETVVLATVVSADPAPDTDFFPLSVNYEEKLYASGSIKTSRFVKRDGKPTDEAVVTRRLIDHAIRPLFPSDYMDEVQVVVTVLSLDPDSDPEFLAMTAVSTALHASNIPWVGPMVSAKVISINDDYLLNPDLDIMHSADMSLMVSFVGDERKFLALEGEANIVPEDRVLAAINFARDNLDPIVSLINDFASEVNPDNEKYEYVSRALPSELMDDIEAIVQESIEDLMDKGLDKIELRNAEDTLLETVFAELEGKYKKVDMAMAFSEIKKDALQRLILDEGRRPDGRKIDEVRPISGSVGVLPRTHGSAVFTRGVTQALTIATLGSPSMEQLIQNMYGETSKRYIHYYNFPPFSVGETGRFGSPGGREIGHGMLAEKAVVPVIPTQDDFPYTIILVSEILSSSGSSSMASTCGSTLALMDAGVPIKEMVGGVGVGLITNDDFTKYVVMTDLAYMEDAFGFLDFKMTGTRTGVTAVQVDMKLPGIPMDLLEDIMEQSHKGRMHVLDEMEKVMSKPRAEISKYAPKSALTKIDPDKIGMVIGSGGKTIKEIEEKTGATLNIEQDGTVVVSGPGEENVAKAIAIVEGITKEVEPGEVYDGEVKKVVDFGAFVEILPGKEGLLHISELAYDYVDNIYDHVKEGDTFQVKVLEVAPEGKISLSKKALMEAPEGMEPRPDRRPGGRSERRRPSRPPHRKNYNRH